MPLGVAGGGKKGDRKCEMFTQEIFPGLENDRLNIHCSFHRRVRHTGRGNGDIGWIITADGKADANQLPKYTDFE